MKPFIVVSSAPATAGGGQVFAADLVAKKIIVFYGGITNSEAAKQAPYRYLGGFDNNATVINAVQFAARQLKGETAKWSGDFTTKKRVFGLIRPETGIDWQYYTSTAKKEGLTDRQGRRARLQRAPRHESGHGEEPGGGAHPHRQAQGCRRDDGADVHVVRR